MKPFVFSDIQRKIYAEKFNCENFFKHHGDGSYFQGTDPLCNHLDQEQIKTFIVDHESLILVFQPYADAKKFAV